MGRVARGHALNQGDMVGVKRKADPHQENQWPCRMGRTGPRSERVTLHRVAPVAIERTGNERHCLSLHSSRTLALTHAY